MPKDPTGVSDHLTVEVNGTVVEQVVDGVRKQLERNQEGARAPVERLPDVPAEKATKAKWVTYAVGLGLHPDTAGTWTRPELVAWSTEGVVPRRLLDEAAEQQRIADAESDDDIRG